MIESKTGYYNENAENEYYEEKRTTIDQHDLTRNDWYWSKISRAQANDLLHGKKDGTFLVRDSSNVNDYTLTVKKDGINKMMRILCKNGKYGFRDPCKFDSLQSLIEYHTDHSLAEYYPEMNIKLEYSLSKNDICSSLNVDSDKIDVESIREKFELANQQYIELTQEYDDYHREYKMCQDEIQKFKQSLNCFEETLAIFEEQIKLNEENQKDAYNHEKPLIAKNRLDIQDKLSEIKEFKRQLNLQCGEKNIESANLDRKINELKPLVNEKKRNTEQIRAILINKIGKADTEKILDNTFAATNNLIYSNLNLTPLSKQPTIEYNANQYDQAQNKSLNYCLIDIANANSYSPTNNSALISSPPKSTNLDKFQNNLQQDTATHNLINSPPLNSLNYSVNNQIVKNRTDAKSDDQKEDSTYLNLDHTNIESKPLIDSDWYVGDMSKEDVNAIMKNQPDGTFLVRDSKNKPEAPFTLTIRVNGFTKMLRILQSNDKYYGLKPDQIEFESVNKLIEHYLKEPLIVFNPDLTILLKYPIIKEQIKHFS